MLTAIVRWSLSRPRLVAAFALLLLIVGILALKGAKYDVFPDFVPAQAEIQTEAPGLDSEQVEQLVTRVVEQSVNGAAGVTGVRSESIPGLSIVQVVFAEGTDPYRSRQIVAEAVSETTGDLPAGVKAPKVQPLTSSTMDLLKIGLVSDKLSPMELRTLADTVVRPRLLATPGVAKATVFGGQIRRIEVRVRPTDLAARGLAFNDLTNAVKASTGVSGGGFIDTDQQRVLIKPSAQARAAADVAAAAIVASDGSVVRIGDVAEVADGPAPLNGDALIMGRPGVMIAMASQYGANTLQATQAVEAALAELKPSLDAQGVTLVGGLHRPANFIGTALSGIAEDLLIGAVLIGLVLFAFMRDLRTVLVSFVSIPLSLLAAVLVMNGLGWAINTMTLGGLAVALGVVVDDAVIDVENIVRRLRAASADEAPEDVILHASIEVRAPVIYATLVVALTLLPVLMLHGIQGSFFSPLAAAFIIATLASLAVAVMVTPPLTLLLLRNTALHPEPPLLVRAKAWHDGALERICAFPRWAVAAAAMAAIATAAGLMMFNSELLPAFKESHFVLGVSGPPGTSLSAMRAYGEAISKDLLAIPGVQSVEQQIGRAEGGEDTWGPNRSEFHVELKPELKAAQQDRVEKSIHAVLDSYPGLNTEVVTFLGDRIGETLTGETAALAVNIYGQDLDQLDAVGAQIAALIKTIPGAADVQVQTPPMTPVVRADVDFSKLSRYGLSAADVLDTIDAAYQGAAAAQIYDNARTVEIAVTTPPSMRQDPEAVGDLTLRSASGVAVPLNQVAKVYLAEGRTSISHEGGQRRQVVTTNPAPQDVARVTKAVQAAIAQKIKLPPGAYVSYAGTAEGAAQAQRELMLNVSIAAGGVVALLLLAFSSGRVVGLILGTAPFALVGGVIAVGLTGASLSLGSLVGFVTLFGIAARNAILLVSHADHLVRVEGHAWSLETVIRATRERVTPILMTALVTALGLLPLAIQTGQPGREIQGPMAIVILGGLVTSTAMSLFLLPSLVWRYGRPRAQAA
ncbi:MAG TPA: efflux RND transporter permease subunit [Caulobacteraceae bacterium]|nr:efflux RND transporter permease subunit [Caulobacteraceae bacterium]